MSGYIRKNKLLVISDTALYSKGGQIYGFEPVVRELEVLQPLFDEIVWLGCKIPAASTALKPVGSGKIKPVLMPATSNQRFNALKVLLAYPVFLYYILRYLPSATHVHTRAPSHPAIIGILISFIDRSRTYWHKYAGDWIRTDAPLTYRLQRSWLRSLKRSNIRVTVNGSWDSDPPQVYNFENPCLFEAERQQAAIAARHKDFTGRLKLLFVGNINVNKGIVELLDALSDYDVPGRFSDLYVIGGGPLLEEIRIKAQNIRHITVHVIGHINREQIDRYYEQCHLMVLPSKSEGFPKVIPEAGAYGCIPVVTDISSLAQTVHDGQNGFLMKNGDAATISGTLARIATQDNLEDISKNAMQISERFTYEHFTMRISKEIFN